MPAAIGGPVDVGVDIVGVVVFVEMELNPRLVAELHHADPHAILGHVQLAHDALGELLHSTPVG